MHQRVSKLHHVTKYMWLFVVVVTVVAAYVVHCSLMRHVSVSRSILPLPWKGEFGMCTTPWRAGRTCYFTSSLVVFFVMSGLPLPLQFACNWTFATCHFHAVSSWVVKAMMPFWVLFLILVIDNAQTIWWNGSCEEPACAFTSLGERRSVKW